MLCVSRYIFIIARFCEILRRISIKLSLREAGSLVAIQELESFAGLALFIKLALDSMKSLESFNEILHS